MRILSAIVVLLWLAGAAQGMQEQYEGRGDFERLEKDQPAIHAVQGASNKDVRRYGFPPYAVAAKPGQVIADIGCGRGKFSFGLAESVGETGKVYCRDIGKSSIDTIVAAVREQGIANMDAAVSEKDDVKLAENSIDVALLSDVYQFVIHQEAADGFLDSLYNAMKEEGVVVVTNVTAQMLYEDEKWKPYFERVIEDFTAHGFEPGRRWIIEDDDDRRPMLVLEFRRPAEKSGGPDG